MALPESAVVFKNDETPREGTAQKRHIEYIFIDESGDLGEYGSVYFTIVALATHAPAVLGRIIKRVRERKLKKKLRELSEIKANNSTEAIRKDVLRRLSGCECSISAVAIQKSKVKENLFKHKEKLYNYLCGLLFEHISLNTEVVDITVDRKHGNMLLQEDFNRYVESRIKSRNASLEIRIRHLESHASSALQVVDFVAWAVNRKFTHGDSSYYDIIKHRIRNQGKEEIWR
ncbi:MAG: DUF3800 domain-containing protein [Candidatus Micrarchaeota archaeon]|nr:DUF3800 domain-containing protein [Candidatus Micrarchaeota archaeon]